MGKVTIINKKTINHSPDKVKPLILGLKEIKIFLNGLNKVDLLHDGKNSGVGAARKCVFDNGNSIVETIVDEVPDKSVTMVFSEFKVPFKAIKVKFSVIEDPNNKNQTTIELHHEVTPKLGFVGYGFGKILLPIFFKKVQYGMIDDLDYYLTNNSKKN